jgi:hypothetical protein
MISSAIANSWFGLKRMTAAIAAGSIKLRDRTAEQLATAR